MFKQFIDSIVKAMRTSKFNIDEIKDYMKNFKTYGLKIVSGGENQESAFDFEIFFGNKESLVVEPKKRVKSTKKVQFQYPSLDVDVEMDNFADGNEFTEFTNAYYTELASQASAVVAEKNYKKRNIMTKYFGLRVAMNIPKIAEKLPDKEKGKYAVVIDAIDLCEDSDVSEENDAGEGEEVEEAVPRANLKDA